ncbi:hypothetical protein ACIBCN_19900 [Nocardia sp. NPDC051052]|uniref:hypothetical protein n=1 Tax=Nocardia sp. NPDC051052 TaxID=3364322 RepID=UPI0037AC7D64
MSSEGPGGMVDKFKGVCISILVAAIAVYCATKIITSIWPTLLLIGGIVGAVWLGIVVFRTWKEHW